MTSGGSTGRPKLIVTKQGAVRDPDEPFLNFGMRGSVLIPGARAPHLVERDDLKLMKPGAVIIDVAIDQGGCVATSRPTTHAVPTFVVDDVVHYCVTNMPGGVPRTSTFALNNATLPYVLELADHGWKAALARNPQPGFAWLMNPMKGFL